MVVHDATRVALLFVITLKVYVLIDGWETFRLHSVAQLVALVSNSRARFVDVGVHCRLRYHNQRLRRKVINKGTSSVRSRDDGVVGNCGTDEYNKSSVG